MVTSTSSTTTFLLDDGTGTFPYDISSKALFDPGFSFSRGREDWQADVTAGQCSFTLDNSDGRFTPGSTIIASPSPIKLDQRIRVRETIPSTAETNLLSAENASFEGGTVGTWVAAGTVLPTVANSSVRAYDGTKSLLVTWAGSGSNPQAQVQGAGFTAGLTYTFAVWVYVPSGGPDVRCGAGATVSGLTSLKDQWVRLQVTFVAASTTPTFFIRSSGTPASSTCYIDAAMVVLGSTIGDFNTLTQTTYNRVTDYLKSLPVTWPATVSTFSTVQLAASDAQTRAGLRILRSYPEEEIGSDSPTMYYTLGEPSGATGAGDTSGNQAPVLTMAGTGSSVVFGNAVGVPGSPNLTMATFAGGKYLVASGITYGATPAIIIAFATTSAATMGLWSVSDLGPADPTTCSLTMTAGTLATGDGGVTIGSGTYNDGLVHVVALRWTALNTVDVYIDGVLTNSALPAHNPRISPIIGANSTGANPYTGSLAHFAVFSTAPTGTRLIAESQAMLTGFAGESGTARLTRLAGYAGIPVGTLDTSLTNVAFKDIAGQSAWGAIQDVAKAEVGLAFIDGSGNLTFHNRDRVAAKTVPDLTIAASFLTSNPTVTVDDADLVNYIEVASETTQVTQTVRDANSITNHGTYPQSESYLVQTDAEAISRGAWTVNKRSEPSPRYGSLTINLMAMTTTQLQAVIAAIAPNCWLRITSMPSQNTGGTTVDVVVQGFTEERTSSSWTLTCNVASRSLYAAWVMGDSTYGVMGVSTILSP